MSYPDHECPRFVIIGGPNGSGKSSAYQFANVKSDERSIWIINPDLLAARLRDIEKLALDDANLEAVIRIERWLESSIRAHQTVGVETVLSTAKYRRLVQMAHGLGFEVHLIYVMLNSPQLNIDRVRLRVLKGGHAVPEDKIVERHARSLEQLPWFLENADHAAIYDNSGSEPRLICSKRGVELTLYPDALPEITDIADRYPSR